MAALWLTTDNRSREDSIECLRAELKRERALREALEFAMTHLLDENQLLVKHVRLLEGMTAF